MNKFKNPMFWIGLATTIFLASGIDPESLVSWSLVYEGLVSIVENPVKLIAVIGAVYAIFNDNGVKGYDHPFKKSLPKSKRF